MHPSRQLSIAIVSKVAFKLRLYLTLIILLGQQSSKHCHDVRAALYYIRGDYTGCCWWEILKVRRPAADRSSHSRVTACTGYFRLWISVISVEMTGLCVSQFSLPPCLLLYLSISLPASSFEPLILVSRIIAHSGHNSVKTLSHHTFYQPFWWCIKFNVCPPGGKIPFDFDFFFKGCLL